MNRVRGPHRRVGAAHLLLVLLLSVVSLAGVPSPAVAAPLDSPLPWNVGHFYTQANGQGGAGGLGYAITNADGIAFWLAFQQLGGVAVLGYPISQRFMLDGFTVQATQRAILQWHPDASQVMIVNSLDRLHDAGKDSWLQVYRQTPPPDDTSPDTGLTFAAIEQRHWALLDQDPAIKAAYWADSDPVNHFGLPMSAADEGNSFVIRMQRTVFQHWKIAVPWASQGQITLANAGDLMKEAGLLPAAAVVPGPMPTSPATSVGAPPSHDWQTPGYVSAVGGKLYDPQGRLLRSVGSNVPNLAYGGDVGNNLEWMRQHHLRWLRLFATGHAISGDRAPQNATAAIAALRAVLQQVDAFNASHDPNQSIYVLVSLTDYYPPGVPGDRHAYDHPIYATTPVLPAPWYRAGVRTFDFDQEHNFGIVRNMPNYEVNYKPWVERLVPALAASKSLMGWQLGNELKARGSPRNGISSAQAYGWYLDFTKDMVDTIRSLDANHLIFMGAQYIAELTDWEYRPKTGLDMTLVPAYRRLVQQMLDACATACWNVWSLTLYDANPYAIDDAQVFHQAGVTTVVTEFGYTLGTSADNQANFGGNRATAIQSGFPQRWQELNGAWHNQQWSVPDLVANTGLAAIAPWASPAPGNGAAIDTDTTRGVTSAVDATDLWAAWGAVAAKIAASP